MAAATSVPIEYIDEITECPICREVFTDPRELPCVHSYCLKCIKEWCKDKQNGDHGSCPQCRKDFQIPQLGGIDALPKNIFVAKLLFVKHISISQKETKVCEVCEDITASSSTKMATAFCLECKVNICETCRFSHLKLKQLSSHKLVSLQEAVKEEDLCAKYPPSYCEKHSDEYIKVYCFQCKRVCCMMCYIEDHSGHKCSDVTKVSDEFKSKIKQDIKDLSDVIGDCKKKLNDLEAGKEDFLKQVKEAELQVSETAERLKRSVDNHKQKILDELEEIRKNRLKEIELVMQNVTQEKAMTASFEKYIGELLSKGTASDIARQADSLNTRFSELMIIDDRDKLVNQLGTMEVLFQESKLIDPKASVNIVGKTVVKKSNAREETHEEMLGVKQTKRDMEVQPRTPKLVHVIPKSSSSSNGVISVAICGNILFVGRYEDRVAVYDTTTFSLQRKLTIAGLGEQVRGLAACDVNNCLYVSDADNEIVHKVDLSNYKVLLKWSVAPYPLGLSVNTRRNVLVACWELNKIQEYTTFGSIVREVCLRDGIGPWHAIQLPSGELVVSHWDTLHRVIVVGLDGQVIRSYGSTRGSQSNRLRNPNGMALFSKHGCVLVADHGNKRIMALNPSLSDARQLPLSVDGGMTGPATVLLDESRDRLYVGENGGQCRVLVFDNVINIDAMFKQ